MTRQKSVIAICVLLLAIGIAIGYYLGISGKAVKNFGWKKLTLDLGESGRGYSFTTEAAFNSDIPFPDVKRIWGKSKFLKPTTNAGNDDLNLGYIISVENDKVDLQKVPSKYKVTRKERYKGKEITGQPIEEVVFSVSFDFSLKDKDGFELVKLKSPLHYIYSGHVNTFQDVVRQSIARHIAERASTIIFSMTVEECKTCKWAEQSFF